MNVILSGQNLPIYVSYFILFPAFVLNILINMTGVCYYIYNSFSVLKPCLFTSTGFYLVRDANTNSLKDTSKIL